VQLTEIESGDSAHAVALSFRDMKSTDQKLAVLTNGAEAA
jgi:hypothetical protein